MRSAKITANSWSTPLLLLEYEDVLTRQEHMQVHGFSLAQVSEVLDTIAVRSAPVTAYYQSRPQLRGPGDEHVLSTAINGAADAIVTHDLADFLPAANNFGVQVITPARMPKERSFM